MTNFLYFKNSSKSFLQIFVFFNFGYDLISTVLQIICEKFNDGSYGIFSRNLMPKKFAQPPTGAELRMPFHLARAYMTRFKTK